jgi:beta-phosphoglucomutase-like phosphatase (HAD superfamily)
MLYTNFIWDFDGTIIDTYPSTINSILETLKEYNISLDYDFIYKKAKITLKDVFKFIKEEYNFNNDIVDKIFDGFSKIPHEDRIKYDKIEEVLIFIKLILFLITIMIFIKIS